MKLILESTEKIIEIEAEPGRFVKARVWQGHAEHPNGGIAVHCYILRVAVKEGQPAEVYQDFERDLQEHAKMRPDVQAIPLRLIL